MPTCVYCGDLAECRDHFECRARSGALGRTFTHGLTVPACMECNQALGDYPWRGMAHRADFLIHTYEDKYRKVLESPTWTPSERRSLGQNLASVVDVASNLRYNLERRFRHLQTVVVEDPDPVRLALRLNPDSVEVFARRNRGVFRVRCANCIAEVPVTGGDHIAYNARGMQVNLGPCPIEKYIQAGDFTGMGVDLDDE